MAGVGDTIIRGNGIQRIRIPTKKSRAGLIFEAQRLLQGGAGNSWLGKNRRAGGEKDRSKDTSFRHEWMTPW
jgi:hypothetical protein